MSKRKTVLLSDIGEIITGNTPKTSNLGNYETDDIPFLKPSDFNTDGIDLLSTEFYISEKARNKARILPVGSVVVTCIGIIGKTKILNMECAFNQQINAIIPKNDNYNRYVAYAILFQKDLLQTQANSAVVPIINKSDFSKIHIPLPPLETQRKIADNLDKVSHTINLCSAILEKLDLLVKSRFVEMFGDPISNQFRYNVSSMTTLCEIIDGDRGKNYPKQEEFTEHGYCLFLNAKNVTSVGFNFTNCMFISKEKDEILHNGKLSKDDVVLTTRGTIGNLAFYTDDIPYKNIRINSGMVILRMNKKLINELFFIEQFRMILKDIRDKIASGTAQPQLPISTMNKIKMLIPPLSLQNQFAAFVIQVDKSKEKVKETLEKAETLKKKLMQDYFG